MDVKKIRESSGLTQDQLADLFGVTTRTVQNWESGSTLTKTTKALLQQLADGEIISRKNEAAMTSAEIVESIPDQQEAMAKAMADGHNVISDAKNIGVALIPAETVEEIKGEAKEELIEEMSIPVISPDVANKINFDVRVYIEENTGELEHINPTELLKDADAAERVLRGAMQPTFIPSDVVFIRFLRNKAKIIDGNIYYFDLKSRPTMIRKVKIEGDKLRLIAENPEFGDVITDFSDILNVADIVGMFRTSFSTQYSEIEAMRRKKDEQIENLITEMGRAGNRQDKMIEQISKLVQHALEKK